MINSNELYNDEAERTVVGIGMVAKDKVLNISVSLEVNDFFDKRHQLIMQAIKELVDDNKDIDIVSVSELLKFNKRLTMAGGREYITSLAMDVITTNNYKHYCKIILKYSKKRKLLDLINGTEKSLADANDIDEVLLSLKGDINSLIANTTSSDIPTLFTGVTDVMDKVNTILTSENKTFGLSTGFKSLDLILSGLCPNKIYVLGDRPAMGKSAIVQQIGEYIAQQ